MASLGAISQDTGAGVHGGPIVLISMPWAMPRRPPLAIGLLHSLLEDAGLNVKSKCGYLDFLKYVDDQSRATARIRMSVRDYEHIASQHYLGEWIFSGPPFMGASWEETPYLDHLYESGFPGDLIEVAREFRRYVPGFLDNLAQTILDDRPAAIGLTTTLSQTIPSLILARLLKERAPHIPIVLGGANCDASMGEAIHNAFDWIDIVVQGEADTIVVDVFSELTQHAMVARREGVIVRSAFVDLTATSLPISRPHVDLGRLPVPTFNQYFDSLCGHPFESELRGTASLPIETSRGCWWGAKNHCTFCGLNGSTMAFRSKDPARVIYEYETLSNRYGVSQFEAADNILDLAHIDTVLAYFENKEEKLSLFYEVKVNLKRSQLMRLSGAGVRGIQPGIESLSTSILRLMRKGTTALQNIRFLRWCAELGIRADWNIIYGFPLEDKDEYARMASLVPDLVHLEPPTWTLLGVERFSPYHSSPEELGIRITGPNPFYDFSYPLSPPELLRLAYSFRYEHLDGRRPVEYARPLKHAIARWHELFFSNPTSRPLLSMDVTSEGCVVIDLRRPDNTSHRILDSLQASILIACDAGAKATSIVTRINTAETKGTSIEDVLTTLDALTDFGLVYEENGLFLALPIFSQRCRLDGNYVLD